MIDGNKGKLVKITCLLSEFMSTEHHSVVDKTMKNEEYDVILISFSIHPIEKCFK
jgi:hypothetical protein